jgi:predicted HTH transcriptional regulator
MSKLLEEIVYHGREERNIEYKQTMTWNDNETQSKVIKAAIALSNIQDGGYIVFGVEDKGNALDPSGMKQDDYDSFNQDDVMVKVNEYADPFVGLQVHRLTINDKRFIIIAVNEFAELPTVCKRDGYKVKRGDIYIRPFYKYESTCIFTETDMRELLDLALSKMISKAKADFAKICPLTEKQAPPRHAEKYDAQIKGLIL